ncbi:PREDICTED: agamous-like MADS-box protein AGL62 [Camelina sativa]|uniref:Agamous-like MADS-box protein AGL62 n=1 Tax=Camelina sativa TaxID=90675 RepID=A0ABM0XR60_CAMSA|nr:PREDICTED: agamous-like MADS-box protein AGL62 [Camelina sativa]
MGRKTKGKQKIEMKKVDNYGDRMIAFSKRKGGIFKKLNELVSMCDVEVAILVFSQAGKPYTFAFPSMTEVAARLNPSGQELFAKGHTGPLVEAYKKQRIHDGLVKMEALEKELALDLDELKEVKKSSKEKKLDKKWWNIPEEGLSMKEMQRRHQALFDLHDNLCEMFFPLMGKDGGSSSSRSLGYDHSGGSASD